MCAFIGLFIDMKKPLLSVFPVKLLTRLGYPIFDYYIIATTKNEARKKAKKIGGFEIMTQLLYLEEWDDFLNQVIHLHWKLDRHIGDLKAEAQKGLILGRYYYETKKRDCDFEGYVQEWISELVKRELKRKGLTPKR